MLDRLGPPPPHFRPRRPRTELVPLPDGDAGDGLFRTLERRRTTRAFDRSRLLPLEALARVLDAAFGARSIAQVAEGFALIKKTSPSGGSLHSIEAYPLLVHVDGAEPGLHRYDVERHALERLGELRDGDAGMLVAGQSHFASAHALVVLTARWERVFWKYGGDEAAYSVVLLEAGHVLQTFALAATELGLGSFVAGAINAGDADARLGIDGTTEGTIAVCGIGPADPAGSPLDLAFEPFTPLR